MAAVLSRRDAVACMCVPPPPPAEAAERAGAVFTGTVQSIDDGTLSTGGSVLPVRRVHLAIDRAWRGVEAGDSVVVITSYSEAACGYSFAVGRAYLVYSVRDASGTWTTTTCSRTRTIDEAVEDLAALGTPVSHGTPARVQGDVTLASTPPARAPAPARRGGWASCAIDRRATTDHDVLSWLSLASAALVAGSYRRSLQRRRSSAQS